MHPPGCVPFLSGDVTIQFDAENDEPEPVRIQRYKDELLPEILKILSQPVNPELKF